MDNWSGGNGIRKNYEKKREENAKKMLGHVFSDSHGIGEGLSQLRKAVSKSLIMCVSEK